MSDEFVKEVYRSECVGPDSRGRSPTKWRDRVKDYLCERCYQRGGRAESSKEGMLGQGEVENFLPWTFPEEVRHPSYR